MKQNAAALVFITLLSSIALSQSLTWQRAYRSPLGNDDEAYAVCRIDDNSFYVAGLTSDYRTGYLLKINKYGDTIWTRLVDYQEFIYAIVVTSDGGCILTGSGGYLSRFNTNGDTVWNRFTGIYEVKSLIKTADGNLVACGYGSPLGGTAAFTKLDMNGNRIWIKTFTLNQAYFKDVIQSINGEYLCIGGWVNTPNYVTFLMKLSDSGTQIWFKYYNISYYPISIEKTNNGFIIDGNIGSLAYLFRVNLNGDSVKFTQFQSLQYANCSSILRLNDNKFYFAYSTGTVNESSTIRLFDPNFNTIKQLVVHPIKDYVNIKSMDFATTSKDYFLACGVTNIFNISNEDFYVARIDSSLNLPPPLSVVKINRNIPIDYRLYQNYPNPFNPATKVEFDVPVSGVRVVLRIYDISGKEIRTLLNDEVASGSYQYSFDASDLSTGVYFCTMMAGDYFATRKMVFLK